MPLPTTTKIVYFYYESQTWFAVIFGMFVQFIFGDKRTLRIGWLIVVSSIFVAMYVMPIIIELINLIPVINIEPGSRVAIGMYAVSSLLSMEILAIIISFLPDAMKSRITKLLGVSNGKSKQ